MSMNTIDIVDHEHILFIMCIISFVAGAFVASMIWLAVILA